ncbi:MAG: transglutaminase family protein [Candidatus Thermoplasmatota archaeon]|nr:transglutaminase family protein [Candidatus Thermoplasmatota archaeon]
MKKNTWPLFLSCILILVVAFSGCEMIFPPITYETTPTRISYELSYGYYVNITGTGRYEVTYLCDTPDVLIGTTTYSVLYNDEYQTRTLFNNTVIHWNISGKNANTFELGINAAINADSAIIADLNGNDALTIQQIKKTYPELIAQYTQVQANETIRFIDPYDPDIMGIANAIYTNEKTNNSFLLAKALFSWLKQHIVYQIHPDERIVRSAAITLDQKEGDCDDLSFLYISLCRALDIPARFIRGYLLTKNIDGSVTATPHAWTEIFVGPFETFNGWIPVESACRSTSIDSDIHQNFGMESAFHLRLFTDDGSNASLARSLTGISYVTHEQNTVITLEPFADIRNYQELDAKKLCITEKNNRYYE